ncbi:protein Mpv17, putative [Pediculus humanus corporis]|uniref:Mitochondrial inner membrane protein Mpv17 n=1 Tax=Pediculus humanus subsp. corporis TaxID=121224 RepID=E0VBY1_PEDHC|nr:protein Mpv17, putative [Pediculus humanus corporis]EEB10887.1 protein Mpv17, putative [Pediculus humanus corporis]
MKKIREVYKILTLKYPIGSQAIQTGLIMGNGDVIAQLLVEKKPFSLFDFLRTSQYVFVGSFFVGPSLRVWYGFIDKIFSEKNKTTAVKKMLVDQLLFAPVFLAAVLSVIGITQGNSLKSTYEKVSNEYSDILKTNYTIWPAFQLFNFYLVPLHYQVLAVQIVAIFWNTYVSWKINKTA